MKKLSLWVNLCAGLLLAALNFQPAIAADTTIAPFTDSFNTATNLAPQYGLNDSLKARQTGPTQGITYTRVPGLSTAGDKAGDPIQAWHDQVNNPNYANKMSMHLRTSAVRLDAPVVNDGTVKVSAVLNPAYNYSVRSEWASLVLANSSSSRGYVSNTDATGVLVRSNGAVQAYHRGKLVISSKVSVVPKYGIYTTSMQVTGKTMTVVVNGQTFRATLASTLPVTNWLFLGRYSDNTAIVTTIDSLAVSKVNAANLALPATSNLKYFGYFASRIEGIPTNHVPDVSGFSNNNWVSISDSSGYRPDILDSCKPNSCVVNTRWQFFTDCPGVNCRLRDDAAEQWQRFADILRPHEDRIAALALMDEAYWQGANYEDVSKAADMLKQQFPDKKVMLNFAEPTISTTSPIPASVDWVAFDQYCQPISTVETTLQKLETATANRPDVELFVYTESARNLCGTAKTDAQLAAIQWDYYNLALRHPRVVGVLPFGFWTHDADPSVLPKTVDAQQRIAARILR